MQKNYKIADPHSNHPHIDTQHSAKKTTERRKLCSRVTLRIFAYDNQLFRIQLIHKRRMLWQKVVSNDLATSKLHQSSALYFCQTTLIQISQAPQLSKELDSPISYQTSNLMTM